MVHVCPFDQEGKLLVHLKKVGNETKALPLASQGKIFLGLTRYSPLKFNKNPKLWSFILKEHLFQTIFCNIQVYHLLRNHSKWLDWSNLRPINGKQLTDLSWCQADEAWDFVSKGCCWQWAETAGIVFKKNYLSIKSLLRKAERSGFKVWLLGVG